MTVKELICELEQMGVNKLVVVNTKVGLDVDVENVLETEDYVIISLTS